MTDWTTGWRHVLICAFLLTLIMMPAWVPLLWAYGIISGGVAIALGVCWLIPAVLGALVPGYGDAPWHGDRRL